MEKRRSFLVSLTDQGRSRLADAERHEREFMLDLHRVSPELRPLLAQLIDELLQPRRPISPSGADQSDITT